MDEERRDRARRNEEFFRGANRAIARDAEHEDEVIEFLCECAQLDCTTRVRLAPEDWREAHERDLRFVVAPGHVFADVERVISERRDYAIVEKLTD